MKIVVHYCQVQETLASFRAEAAPAVGDLMEIQFETGLLKQYEVKEVVWNVRRYEISDGPIDQKLDSVTVYVEDKSWFV